MDKEKEILQKVIKLTEDKLLRWEDSEGYYGVYRSVSNLRDVSFDLRFMYDKIGSRVLIIKTQEKTISLGYIDYHKELKELHSLIMLFENQRKNLSDKLGIDCVYDNVMAL